MLVVAASVAVVASCGSTASSFHPVLPPPAGADRVTLLLSSTANDKLSEFELTLTSITLMNASGTAVAVYSNSNLEQFAELIHLNAGSEPLITTSVPQGVYTSAAVLFARPQFSCVTVNPFGGLEVSTYLSNLVSQSATVNLPSPITVGSSPVTLSLDLQASQSSALSSCAAEATYSITPTFNLTVVPVSSQPTNVRNGLVAGIDGRILSVDAAGQNFTLETPDGASLTFHSDGGTVFQGVNTSSALTAGMFVDMDGAVQLDGSLEATRIAVEDATAHDVIIGPLTEVVSLSSILTTMGLQQQGDDISFPVLGFGAYFQFSSATAFQISGRFSNLASLPFPAKFDGSSIAVGQNVYISTPTIVLSGGTYTQATTVTLMPQTINGTIVSATSSGNFQIYTLSLAPYDLIPQLNGATSVVVYVDGSTQLLNSAPLAPGRVVRFNGLIFNDSGTLRMDCGQANDGVAE